MRFLPTVANSPQDLLSGGRRSRPRKQISWNAFSLVELIAVVALVTMMAVLGIPAISSLGRASGVTQSVTSAALSFEQARAHAMGRNTYVRVGFRQDSEDAPIQCAMLESLNGQVADFQSSTNCRLVTLPKKLGHVRMAGSGDSLTALPGMARNAVGVTASAIENFQAYSGGKNLTFSNVIQFGPSGEVSLETGSTVRWIELPFVDLRAAKENYAVIQISGLSGQVRVFRP